MKKHWDFERQASSPNWTRVICFEQHRLPVERYGAFVNNHCDWAAGRIVMFRRSKGQWNCLTFLRYRPPLSSVNVTRWSPDFSHDMEGETGERESVPCSCVPDVVWNFPDNKRWPRESWELRRVYSRILSAAKFCPLVAGDKETHRKMVWSSGEASPYNSCLVRYPVHRLVPLLAHPRQRFARSIRLAFVDILLIRVAFSHKMLSISAY